MPWFASRQALRPSDMALSMETDSSCIKNIHLQFDSSTIPQYPTLIEYWTEPWCQMLHTLRKEWNPHQLQRSCSDTLELTHSRWTKWWRKLDGHGPQQGNLVFPDTNPSACATQTRVATVHSISPLWSLWKWYPLASWCRMIPISGGQSAIEFEY